MAPTEVSDCRAAAPSPEQLAGTARRPSRCPANTVRSSIRAPDYRPRRAAPTPPGTRHACSYRPPPWSRSLRGGSFPSPTREGRRRPSGAGQSSGAPNQVSVRWGVSPLRPVERTLKESYGLSTISGFRLEIAASTSVCSGCGTWNLVSVATRWRTERSQSAPAMPSPACDAFILRPM